MSLLNTTIQIIIGIATFAIYWQLYEIYVSDNIKNFDERQTFGLFHGIGLMGFCFSMRNQIHYSTNIALGLFGTCTAVFGVYRYWEMLGASKYLVMILLLGILPVIGSHVQKYSEFLDKKNIVSESIDEPDKDKVQ